MKHPFREDLKYITICKHRSFSCITVTSLDPFFENEVTWVVSDEKLIFRVASIDDNKRTLPTKHKLSRGYQFSISVGQENAEKRGYFLFDEEETNEDQVTIYWNDIKK